MQLLKIHTNLTPFNGTVCYYPENISSLKQFAEYITERKYISLVYFDDNKSVYPYYSERQVKEVYLKTDDIGMFEEIEANVISESEYVNRLRKIVETKCIYCENYIDDDEELDLDSHRETMNLDGKCYRYRKIK